MHRFFSLLFILLVAGPLVNAQEGFEHWLKEKEGFRIQPFLMLQLWSNYSMDQKVFNSNEQRYEAVDDRFNVLLRRARVGFRAQAYENLRFTFMGAYDLIGRDVHTALIGNGNNASLPEFGVWDAFAEWRISKGSEGLFLTAGYFRPQLSRESITSGWVVNSMEKAMSQNYIRRHLTGYGPGRAPGLNLGGLWVAPGKKLGFNYNVGIFNPLYIANDGNSAGKQASPLFVGRAVFMLGDPEMTSYGISYNINYFGQRKGLSLALNGSWQGANDLFQSSYTFSTDLLYNWGPFNLDAEWNSMWRSGARPSASNGPRAFTYHYASGHLRAGYNLVLNQRYFLEPSFMVVFFNGALDAEGQGDARAVGANSGEERTYDAGINWYLNKNRLKVMLHYTWNSGEAGEAAPGFTGNPYFSQPGLGAIQRGNWLGLGLGAIF